VPAVRNPGYSRRLLWLACWLAALVAAVAGAALLPPAAAQAQERCFPETGYCISGRIRAFWEQSGGLPTFGFPIGPQQAQTLEGRTLQAQQFERTRLELHPDNPAPYDVLMGRLGADRLAQQGRDWQRFVKSDPQADCRFFAETGHNVCGAFLARWRSGGLELDGLPGFSEVESLALFGLPLSGELTEELEGAPYMVQWFERARFELHPELGPGVVLLGLLGRELRGAGVIGPASLVDRTQDFEALGFPDQRKVVRDTNGALYVAYRKRHDGMYRIFVARSTDDGASWRVLNGDRPIEGVGDYQQRVPSIAIDGENTLHVAWYGTDSRHPGENERQIKYTQSRDGGATWSPWINVAEVPGHAGEDRWQEHPAVYARGTTVTIVWEGLDEQSGGEERIKLTRSTDGGRSWTAWQNVAPPSGNGYSRPTLVEGGDGRSLYLLAYAERGPVRQVVWTQSSDGGKTWRPWTAVAPGPADQRHVSLAIDGADRLHAVWRQQTGGANTQVVYASYDGRAWSSPGPVAPSGAYQFFPSIAVTGAETLQVVWTETSEGAGYPQDDPELGQVVGATGRAGQRWGRPQVLSPAGQSAIYGSLRAGRPTDGGLADLVWMDTSDPQNRYIRHATFSAP
jgi:hypothetical protein